ncbi:uncharacterized protein Dwil_GK12289 [Drosophila willistoni]|uniref:Uncharacterized protein n=1 Tax=Drosophila willistoni TaxID=7260 RepID=B4N6M6_DROWI|nr:uncharacterized protein Dwil_GK12289 [Drosophila willistoni]
MTCGLCFDQGDAGSTVKCLLNALESIKAHVLMLQKTSSNDAKTISDLQTRNEKLHKALELRQKEIDSRINPNIHVDKKMKFSPIKKTDSPLPQSQNSLNMNIAINSFEISPSDDELIEDEDETIAETESATKRTPRKLCRKLDVKNVENVQPAINWMGKTPNSQSLNKLSLTRRSSKLKQTRLQFQPDKQSQQEVIVESPNLFTSLKQAKQSQTRSLLQKNVKDIDFAFNNDSSNSTTGQQPYFDLEKVDEDELLQLSEQSMLPPPATLPTIKTSNTTSDSLILLTPSSQDIVFLDDSSDDISNLGTMDLMAEVMKEDQTKALELYEQRMIQQQKHKTSTATNILARPSTQTCVKEEPQSQTGPDAGNESTKLPEEIERYIADDVKEEEKANESAEMVEEPFPRPQVIKQEKELTLKEKYNIECEECEKLINFMGANLNEEKIRGYLSRCRHQNNAPLTPPGFWNPLMVSLAPDDPRNEVLIDTRFKSKDQPHKQQKSKK